MAERGKDPDAARHGCCPHCKAHKHQVHIWKCPAAEMCAALQLALQELRDFLKPVRTLPLLLRSLEARIRRFALGEVPDVEILEDRHGRQICAAVALQDNVGWLHLLKGRVTKEWREAQIGYYQ